MYKQKKKTKVKKNMNFTLSGIGGRSVGVE